MASSKTTTRVRDAGTGQFVPKAKAKTNPKTTVTEVIRIKRK